MYYQFNYPVVNYIHPAYLPAQPMYFVHNNSYFEDVPVMSLPTKKEQEQVIQIDFQTIIKKEEQVIEKKQEISSKARTIDQDEGQSPKPKINIRNIIPNIARKIIRFICSSESRALIKRLFPGLTKQQLSKFFEFVNSLKKQLGFYIGNKDLLHIWYKSTKSPRQTEYLKIVRILSKYFLNNACTSSILLSKRMKPELKLAHLKYRNKMITLLKSGYKLQTFE